MSATAADLTLPKEGLYRANAQGVALRAAGESAPVMAGHFAVFNQWTEINSWEGNFLERFLPGAFKKTISENRDGMKPLFQHGFDYMIGDKPLGTVAELREDDEGVYYEVPLLDAPYVREELMPGLEAGVYGASFRFRVIREEVNEEPEPSTENPHALPERSVIEAKVTEFGPVTFPAYEGASAGMRSLDVEELVAQAAMERMRARDADRAGALAVRFQKPETPKRDESEEADDSPDTPVAADADDAAGDTNTSPDDTPEVDKAPEEESITPEPEGNEPESEESDAPPEESAEADEPHPESGRRGNGLPAKSRSHMPTPPWRQNEKPTPPWRCLDKEK